MSKLPILISGVQPTNKLTLGNYLGAIKKVVKNQKDYECYMFVADLHSITIPLSLQKFSFKELKEFKWRMIKTYVACGIDPSKTKLFIQSEIQEHLELFYFLLTHTGLGELKRMTQYKHLSQQFREPNGTEMALMGLLVYPVLMSADILLYNSEFVAIGEDQTQHLELTVNIAERINSKYGSIFTIPKALNPSKDKAGIKIKDLQDPSKKMSKSSKSYEGVIFLDDDPEAIKEKIMRSKTDSFNKVGMDRDKQPGITNLLDIYSAVMNISFEEAFSKFRDSTYKELKESVVDVVVKELTNIQNNYKNINETDLKCIIDSNNEECRKIARSKLDSIYSSI